MKKISLAIFLLTLASVLFAVQWRSETPQSRQTVIVAETNLDGTAALINRLLKACRDRNRNEVLKCWVSGPSFDTISPELRKLPSVGGEWTTLDARSPANNRAEIWLTGTVDRHGNGCTVILVKEEGNEFRIKGISALEDILTSPIPQ